MSAHGDQALFERLANLCVAVARDRRVQTLFEQESQDRIEYVIGLAKMDTSAPVPESR